MFLKPQNQHDMQFLATEVQRETYRNKLWGKPVK